MKAVRFHEYGGPEVLKYEDVPDAKPRRDQVLVRVRACALNHLDLWLRKGVGNVPVPHINGSDVAGEVAELGEYITDLKVGQRVLLAPMVFCNHCAYCASGQQNFCRQYSVLGTRVDGGNCELLATARVNVVPMPDNLNFEQAAALPLVLVTAWHMLVSRAKIQPGQTVLVIGAGSGVGSIAIQIGKLFNCRVITTAGDEHKLEKGRELGADFTINHYQQKISEEVRKITAKEGVDIVFEHVGKAVWEECMKSLKPGGTLVTCGATTGPEVGVDIRFLFSRQYSLLGSYMGTMGDFHGGLKHAFSGRLKPVVDKRFPLGDARAAHERLEKSEMFGKVVLIP
ncbi:MAG TPA: zinc-binding dehydrogenase [Terriglobales bacterium]|nr:zinc-binding dehydrogenase [Terriglobales bacterium]